MKKEIYIAQVEFWCGNQRIGRGDELTLTDSKARWLVGQGKISLKEKPSARNKKEKDNE
ncbi:MAG: hypothetical protein WC959_05445 [Kiritimatiellales bacterium]